VCIPCLEEIYALEGRRSGYVFTHCASCGPRASVLRALPWDRERTTLAPFPLCADCRREYEDPEDRRYHAEAIACPACGPRLVARNAAGRALASDPGARGAAAQTQAGDAVAYALAVINAGGIVAIKGYGGFHLALDATNEETVSRLRKRKGRPAKPLALLVPDLTIARTIVELSDADEALLAGPLRPVVVAPQRPSGCADLGIASGVAPTTSDHGLLLPSTPLQHLLLCASPGDAMPRPRALVLTSANRSGDPTLWDDAEALRELVSVADLILLHDREVARPCDDSVFRTSRRGAIPMRLSRGAAPLVLRAPGAVRAGACVLALGGDLKAAPALAIGSEIVLEAHVGDLESPATADAALERALRLCRERGVRPDRVVHDLHPGYVGTRLVAGLAARFGAETLAVQHHHAHALAAAVEHGLDAPFLAIVLDGFGFGSDGTLWGGEILALDGVRAERAAHLEMLRIPGGDAAVREPWRSAARWLARAFPDGDAPALPWHTRQEAGALALLAHAARRGINATETSSCGRLFDAVASLLDCGDRSSFEGEAAIALEALAAAAPATTRGTCAQRAGAEAGLAGAGPAEVDSSAAGAIPCADLVRGLVFAAAHGEPRAALARRFHDALAARLTARAATLAAERGLRTVVLSGGCLQNRLLAETLIRGLEARGLVPLAHRLLPPNDGSLAVGQVWYGLRRDT
jgi:hydrogenase maturation protein HypF